MICFCSHHNHLPLLDCKGKISTHSQKQWISIQLSFPPFLFLSSYSEGGILSILVPARSQAGGRWQCSGAMTALHCLTAVTFTKSLLYLGACIQYSIVSRLVYSDVPFLFRKGNKNASSQLLSYFCSLAPDITPGFIEPSLPYLTSFWQDPMGIPIHCLLLNLFLYQEFAVTCCAPNIILSLICSLH